jgi:hypothetical protein
MYVVYRTYLTIMCLEVSVALVPCRLACEDSLSGVRYALFGEELDRRACERKSSLDLLASSGFTWNGTIIPIEILLVLDEDLLSLF